MANIRPSRSSFPSCTGNGLVGHARAELKLPWLDGFEFRGYPFWKTDPFRTPNFGLQRNTLRVLISGGGDGALQDLLRIIFRADRGQVSCGKMLQSLLADLTNAQAFSTYCAQAARDTNCNRLPPEQLWAMHSRLVEEIASETDAWPRIVRALINERLIDGTMKVTLVFRQAMFSGVYALNSILFHLLLKFFRDENPAAREALELRVNTAVTAIRTNSQAHQCARNPRECFQFPHIVTLEERGSAEEREFDCIIVRHGIIPKLPLPRIGPQRQV